MVPAPHSASCLGAASVWLVGSSHVGGFNPHPATSPDVAIPGFPDCLPHPRTPVSQATQTNKGHGRIEIRTASLRDDVAWLQERHRWPGLAAVGKITASRQIGERTSLEGQYYLLSQAYSPERFNAIAREHWGIENRLHWMLDVVFHEDQSRSR